MTARQRLFALALAAALAACGSTTAGSPGLLLAEPSAVAVFHGLTSRHPGPHPYLAVANAASNDLTIVDAVDDEMVPAPVALRPLVFPVPGRPALLAAARLGVDPTDPPGTKRPDLLVAVSAGGSELQVIRTWALDGAIDSVVPLGGDVLALTDVPTATANEARVAAALSGGRIAVVTFRRSATDDSIALAGVPVESGDLNFQPVALAATPEDASGPVRIWAASPDQLPGGALGVAGIDPATATVVQELDALAPTRLVAALELRERAVGEDLVDPGGWSTVQRVYAVLDEAGCGESEPMPCGMVALDPTTNALAPGLAGDAVRAPVAVPGRALALAASGPPAEPPSDAPADQVYAAPFMRILPETGAQRTTGVAALASTDGRVYWVDLGRWAIPSNQVVWKNVRASVRPDSPAGADQWIVLADTTSGAAIAHGNSEGLASAVTVTPGYTPGSPSPPERWKVTYEGVLPNLEARRAESGDAGGGAPWLALQVGPAPFGEVVDLLDPAAAVSAGDVVVVEPSGVPGCTDAFEATVESLLAPTGEYTGGAVRLVARDPANGAWNACLAALVAGVGGPYVDGSPRLRATFRAGGYVLVRGTHPSETYEGRPQPGEPFAVRGRRLFYVPESCAAEGCRWPGLPDDVGADPVTLGFTLALEGVAPARRDLALNIDTFDGRAPMRAADPLGTAVGARGAVPFDRSPYAPAGGVRFFVPYGSRVVLDGSPTDRSGRALR